MPIELHKDEKAEAIASIQRYFRAHFEAPHDALGNIAAGALLGYFLTEIAPLVYNRAVADVQERLAQRVADVDIELHEDAFTYWRAVDGARKPRR